MAPFENTSPLLLEQLRDLNRSLPACREQLLAERRAEFEQFLLSFNGEVDLFTAMTAFKEQEAGTQNVNWQRDGF